jgi:hypothetical protein
VSHRPKVLVTASRVCLSANNGSLRSITARLVLARSPPQHGDVGLRWELVDRLPEEHDQHGQDVAQRAAVPSTRSPARCAHKARRGPGSTRGSLRVDRVTTLLVLFYFKSIEPNRSTAKF